MIGLKSIEIMSLYNMIRLKCFLFTLYSSYTKTEIELDSISIFLYLCVPYMNIAPVANCFY